MIRNVKQSVAEWPPWGRRSRLRDLARHVALNGLAAWDRRVARAGALTPRRIHILLLHHVFDDEIAPFRRLLKLLSASHTFISYSEAVRRILENDIDGTYLAFSFDDGLKCVRQAAAVLEEFAARACFFVCPPLVGETNPAMVARFCHERLRCAPVDFLSWDDVDRLVERGHEIGGHTMQHVRLSQLDVHAAQDEIGQTRAVLLERLGAAEHFAWPYGRFADVHRAAIRAVFDAGFRSCASGVRGCHGVARRQAVENPFAARELCLRRESVEARWPSTHWEYFLRASGRRPLSIDETWPTELSPLSTMEELSCASPSMRSRSGRAAA